MRTLFIVGKKNLIVTKIATLMSECKTNRIFWMYSIFGNRF